METPATTFAPVMKFRFGAEAHDAEGATGAVAHVVVDATTFAVKAVGVRFGLFGRVAYAPVARVDEASDAHIGFTVTRAEIERDGKQPSGVRLGTDTAVTLNGKRLGKLSQVSFNAHGGALRHLVVDRGIAGEAVVSASGVVEIGAAGVKLNAASNGAKPALTPFRPDAELREDAHRALESYNRLRVDMPGINVTAIDGVLWLRGHVSSELNRRLAQDLVGSLHGLAELHNELLTDQDLAATISHALSRDPRTASDHIGVYAQLGRVNLRGGVRTAAARETAEQIAEAAPGVGAVTNDLIVDPNANVLAVMAGVTGHMDVVPGGR